MSRTNLSTAKKPGRRKALSVAKSKGSSSTSTVSPEPQEFPISNSMLRAMYDAMVESRLWAQSRNLVPAISEATAVPSALVLHRTDTLAVPPDGRTLYPVSHLGTTILPLDPAGVQAACDSATRKGRGAVITI